MRRPLLVVATLVLICGVVCAEDPSPEQQDAEALDSARGLCARAGELAAAGKHAEAIDAYREASRIFEEVGGADGDAMRAVMKLATLLYRSGRHDEAADALARARVILLRISGGAGPEAAKGLDGLARLYERMRRHADALRLREEALALRRTHYESDHPDVATSLTGLGLAYGILGRSDRALPFFEEALAMRRRLFEGDHPDVVFSLGTLAAAYRGLGRVDDALPLHEEALAMCWRLFAEDDGRTASSLSELAGAYGQLGRHADALPLHEEALAMRRRLVVGDHVSVARALRYLGSAYHRAGRLKDALPLLEEAASMLRRLHNGDHLSTALSLTDLAALHNAMGRSDDARRLFEEAVPMLRRLLPADHPAIATALGNLAVADLRLGRYVDALALSTEAFAMRRRLVVGDHPLLAGDLNNLAGALAEVGRSEEALERYEEALAMLRRVWDGDHPDVAAALGNLASVHGELGRHGESLALQEEALAMRRRLFDGDHPGIEGALGNLAVSMYRLGRTADAVAAEKDALAMRRRLYGDDHPAVARGLQNQGAYLHRLGRRQEATKAWREAVALGRRTAWPGVHLPLVDLARHALADGDPEAAARLLGEAIAHVEAARGDSRALGAEAGARYASKLRGAADPFALMAEAQVAMGRPAAALGYLERGRARAMLDLLARGRTDPLAHAAKRARDRGDDAALATIDAARGAVAEAEAALLECTRRVDAAQTTGRLPEMRRAVAAETVARRALTEAMRLRLYVVREALPETRPLAAAEISALLAPRERMLFYGLGSRASYVFVVSSGEIHAHKLTGLRRQEIADYGRALAGSRGTTRGRLAEADAEVTPDAGRRVFEMLVPPAAWDEIHTAPLVYVLPHGALHALPFEALVVDAEDDAYWVDEGPPIAYAPSASVLAHLRERRIERTDLSLAALGDPSFEPSEAWPETGALVRSVDADGQAARLGLRPGDVITSYGGRNIDGSEALRRALAEATGSATPLLCERDGETRRVVVQPGKLGIRVAREAPSVAGPKLLAGAGVARRLRGASTRRGSLAPLPGTRREVEGIAAAVRAADEGASVEVLLGRAATEARLYAAVPGARFLHLATHALVDERKSASFSGLALAMPRIPVAGDDGFLALVDLLGRWRGRLEGTEMAVLSACESQRGKLERDEGMLALPWGFCFAGCRSVVGSLWAVDDDSTAVLMAEFYRRLLERGARDKARALHEARRALRKTHPEPYHWAPFVFIGDPR